MVDESQKNTSKQMLRKQGNLIHNNNHTLQENHEIETNF